MSVNILIFSIWSIIGGWAVPYSDNPSQYDEAGYWWYGDGQSITKIGFLGNQTTCTLQGFFLFFCSHSAMFYFALLSVYSFVGVNSNYNPLKYKWIEKYIHVLAHLLPLGGGLALIYLEAYNFTGAGVCFVTGDFPYGCEVPGHERECVECVRGPSDKGVSTQDALWFAGVSELLILVIPTMVMGYLYFTVRRNQSDIFIIQAKTVAKQTLVYLATIYLVDLPLVLIFFDIVPPSVVYFQMFAMINFQIFGFWNALAYLYFTVPRRVAVVNDDSSLNIGKSNKGGENHPSDKSREFKPSSIRSTRSKQSKPSSARVLMSAQVLMFNSEEMLKASTHSHGPAQNNVGSKDESDKSFFSFAADDTDHTKINKDKKTNDVKSPTSPESSSLWSWLFRIGKKEKVTKERISKETVQETEAHDDVDEAVSSNNSKAQRKYSFNIFDGTNASGAFTKFIFEGDESDAEDGEKETEYWGNCQGL